MKNSQLELEIQLKDKNALQLKFNKKFHLDPAEKSNIEREEKSKFKMNKELNLKAEINNKIKEKLSVKRIRKVPMKFGGGIKIEEKSSLESEVGKKENIYIENSKFTKKDNETQKINNKSIFITKENNNIIKKKNYIRNIFSFIFSLVSCTFFSFKEEKRLIIPGEEMRIKTTKNRNGFIEDKNKSRNYLNLNEYILNIKNNIISFSNNIIYSIIIISLIQIVLSNNNLKFIEYKFSNITLKINGFGYKNVFTSSSSFNSDYYPNMIYINGKKQASIKYYYNFNKADNFIKLIWNNSIDYCQYMFYECKDITEIDLSNFNTSLVRKMNNMFSNCLLLSSFPKIIDWKIDRVNDISFIFLIVNH